MEEHHPKKLLDQVRDAIRLKHHSIRAGQTYILAAGAVAQHEPKRIKGVVPSIPMPEYLRNFKVAALDIPMILRYNLKVL